MKKPHQQIILSIYNKKAVLFINLLLVSIAPMIFLSSCSTKREAAKAVVAAAKSDNNGDMIAIFGPQSRSTPGATVGTAVPT